MTCLIEEQDKTLPVLSTETARLRALYGLDLLDTEQETEYNELAELAAAICATPMSAITLLDEHRQWLKAAVGLGGVKETPREMAFCDYTIRGRELLLVENAREDYRFATNPLVTGQPGIQFYAGVPLHTPDGYTVGALCVLDRRARTLTEQQRNALRVLARQVTGRLELRLQQKVTAAAIAEKDRLAAGLLEYQSQLEAANDLLRRLATTDELTGLRNRRSFDERLTFEFAMARRKGRALSVVFADADDFKRINDEFGHPAGDAVLKTLAEVLKTMVRTTDLPVRFGGEEFAVLMPETDEASALGWCQRLQEALAVAHWKHRPVTVSLGVAGLKPWCGSPAQLVTRADEALYRAKANGKNCAVGSAELCPAIVGSRELAGSIATRKPRPE